MSRAGFRSGVRNDSAPGPRGQLSGGAYAPVTRCQGLVYHSPPLFFEQTLFWQGGARIVVVVVVVVLCA